MVAVVAGNGLGLERSSVNILGGRGQLGSAGLGRANNGVTVNAATGNLIIQNTDEILIGRGPDAVINRTYNSLGAYTNLAGTADPDNWITNTQRKIVLAGTGNAAGSTATLTDWDGTVIVFNWVSAAVGYKATENPYRDDTLTWSGNVFTWTEGKSRTVQTFASNIGGRLINAADADGNTVTYTYDAATTAGKLTKVTTANHTAANTNETTLTYSGTNLATLVTSYWDLSVATPVNKTLTRTRYAYDTSNRLITVTVDKTPGDNAVTDAVTFVTNYTYVGNSKQVATIRQTDTGSTTVNSLAITYDASGRVATMTQAATSAAADNRVTTFAYDTTNRVTTVTDALGNISKMTYDTAGRLTRIEEPAPTGGNAQFNTFEYDANGNVLYSSIYDGAANLASNTFMARDYFQYDANGNVTSLYKWNGSGYDVTLWTYGIKNEVLTETRHSVQDPDGYNGVAPSGAMTTRYVYDAENHLRFMISAEGRVTEYVYDAPGNLISTITYTGTRYDLTGVSNTSSIAESTLAAWVSGTADKSQTQRTDNVYDFRGNITTATSWSQTDASGNGVTTANWSQVNYVYDQYGNLLSKLVNGTNDLGGDIFATETFVYDGLGRVISTTDLYGVTSTIAINDGTRVTTITTPNQATKTLTYNIAGELLSEATSGSGLTTGTVSYAYDKLGRLRMKTDEVGVKTYYVYDKQSRLTGEIDGDGSLTEFKYDAADRLIATVQYAIAVSAANITTLNTVTTNTEIATIRPAASGTDRWAWSIYDKAGRLVETIDAAGAVAKLDYDGAGRLTNTTRFNAVLAAATVTGFQTTPPTTLVLPAADDNYDRATRTFYDNDGLLIATLDEEGYLAEHVYDKAGRKVETIRYSVSSANHLTSAAQPAYWRTATLAQLKTQATASPSTDIHNYWIYDGRGLLAAAIDGEGNVTRLHYTARGDVDLEVRGQQVPANTSYTLATLPAATGTLEQTRFLRNAAGQVTSRVRYLSGGQTETTAYAYDNRGRLLTQTTSETVATETRTQRFRYDLKGRLIGELDGVGSATLVANPTDAQIATAINTYGTRYNYDVADRLISRIDPDGTGATGLTTRFYYDTDGQLRYEINALGEVTEYRYNVLEDRSESFVYGARIASATLTTLIGGLVNTAVINAVTAITNTATTGAQATFEGSTRESRTQFAYSNRGELTTTYSPLYPTSPTQSNYSVFSYYSFGDLGQTLLPTDTSAYHWENQTRGYTRRGQKYYDFHYLNGSSLGSTQETYDYDAFGRVAQQYHNNTDWRRNWYYYDRSDRVTLRYDSSGSLYHAFGYDARSNLISSTDRNGKVTTFAYDLFNRNVTTTTAEGVVSTVKKNAYGQTIQITDGAGRTTSYTYDKNGNLKTVTDAAGTTTNNYDNADRLISTVDAKGVITQYSYDAANRVLTRVEDQGAGKLNLTTTYVYDAKGQTISMTDALGVVTTYAYDLKGQKTRIIQDQGSGKLNITTEFVYRADGKVTQQIDAVGTAQARTTFFEYDTLGRLTRKTEDQGSGKLNIVTNYAYDVNNNLVAVSDNLARVTRLVYDKENRLVATVNAEGEVVENGYDNEGRVIWTRAYATRLDPATLSDFTNLQSNNHWLELVQTGSGIRFDVRTKNQTTGVLSTVSSTALAWSGSDSINRTLYDGDGRAVYAVDGEGYVTKNVYDGANNVIKTLRYAAAVSVDNSATKATLDALVPAGDPSDAAITVYYYDGANRLYYITDPTGMDTYFVMDAVGQITATYVAYGHATDTSVTTRVFDNVGRVTSETRAWSTAEAATTTYVYNAHGNVTSMTDARGFVTTRTWDNLGRMLSETVPLDASTSATTSYQYDARGNRVKITDPRNNVGYFFYDGVDRLTLQMDPEGYVTETAYLIGSNVSSVKRYYNKANNQASVSVTVKPTVTGHGLDATTSFAYDKAYRVTSATDAEGYVESYAYNGLGNRWRVTNKLGGTTDYSYYKNGRLGYEYVVQNVYNESGGLVATAYNKNYYQYDARGNLTAHYESFGLAEQKVTTYAYDKLDRLISKTDPVLLGQTPITTYQYDKRGNLILQTNADGGKIYSFYDDNNRKIAEISPVLTLTNWTYDANGNVLTQRIWAGTTSAPASPGGTPPVGGGAFRETQFAYDRNNRLVQSTIVNVRTGSYNGSTYVTNAGQNLVSTNQYDSAGNLIKETDANGASIYHWYDKNGREIAKVDQENHLTTWVRDAEGNALEDRRFANKVGTQFAVTLAVTSDVTNLVNSAGYNGLDRITVFAYDRNGRRTLEGRYNVNATNVSGNSISAGGVHSYISYAYNGLGEVTQKTEANGDTTNYSYDNQGRLTWQRDAGITDFNGVTVYHRTYFYYDGNNNLVRSVEQGVDVNHNYASGYDTSNDRVTRFGYDGGKLRYTIDPTGFVRYAWYDIMGRQTYDYYTRYKSDGTADTSYNGNLTSYDLAGRVYAQWQADYTGNTWTTKGALTRYGYNAFGEVTVRYQGTDTDSGPEQERYEYDNAGRVIKSTGGDGVQKFFIYDANGNVTATLQSNGRDITGDTVDSLLAYTGANLAAMNVADVVGTLTTFDKRNMALSTLEPNRTIASATASVTTVQSLTRNRTYNAFGEVLSETDARGNVTSFAYNTMGRLTQKTGPVVTIVGENGVETNTNPIENYYYDLSGRMVAMRDAVSNFTGTAYYTTRTLLAGSGYGGADPKVLKEFRPDGSVMETRYDAFGDARRSIDGLGRVTQMSYDAASRLTQVIRPSGNTDYYAYDGLGQRIKHWNSAMSSPIYGDPPIIGYDPKYGFPIYGPAPIIGYTQAYEFTDYDIQGRVSSSKNYAGDTTSYSYSWNIAATNTGLGLNGAWVKTTSFANGYSTSETTDSYGRMLTRTDQGGRVYTYSYNRAGQLTGSTSTVVNGTGGQNLSYTYYNTGRLATMLDNTGGAYGYSTSSTDATYTYDADGNRRYERYQTTGYYYDYYGGSYPYTITHQEGTATWDGLNRMTSFNDTGASGNGAVIITNKYDANGNVRRTTATYSVFDYNGNITTTQSTKDHWYKYDALNRFTVTKGELVGGVIVRGASEGRDITYNLAGERATVSRTNNVPGFYDPKYGSYPGYSYETREIYTYNVDGRLVQMNIATGAQGPENGTPPTATGPGVLRALYTLDGAGRVTNYTEYAEDGATVNFNRYSVVYDLRNNVTSESTSTRKFENTGTNTYVTSTSSTYGAGGIISSSSSTTYKNGAYSSSDSTSYTYEYWDSEKQKTITSAKSPGGTHTSTFYYDQNAHLTSVSIQDGRPRTVNFTNDAQGQVLSRTEVSNAANNPKQLYYYFNGLRVGANGNNGNDDPEFVEALAQRTQGSAGNGAFANGATYANPYADFDQSYDPINPQSPGSVSQQYTVRDGDTLQSIAQAIWGDASLWYMLAEANGLTSQSSLTAGQQITIPNKVSNVHNNASTFRPYDPNKAIGDVNPTTPTAPKPPKKPKCGVFGQILLAVIAVAVAIILPELIPALAPSALGGGVGGAILSGAIGAAAGSVVSQAVGVATGIQDKFSFKGVALAAIGGAVGGAFKGIEFIKGASKFAKFANDVVRGMVSSTATQGIAVATGLQKKFDWVGVAASGIASGIGGFVDRALGVESLATNRSISNIANHAVSNMAEAIASAGTRSLIEGTNFGDNLISTLPNAVGSTIGEIIGGSVTDSIAVKRLENAIFKAQDPRFDEKVRRQVAREGARGLNGSALNLKPMLAFGSFDGKTTSINETLAQLGGIDPSIGGVTAVAALEELGHWADRRAQLLSGEKYADPVGDEGAMFSIRAVAALTQGRSGNITLHFKTAGGGAMALQANSTMMKLAAMSSVGTGRVFRNNVVDGVQYWGPGGHFGTTFLSSFGAGQGLGVDPARNLAMATTLGVMAQIADMASYYDAYSLVKGKYGDKITQGILDPLAVSGDWWTEKDEAHLRTMLDGLHALPATEAEATPEWLNQQRLKTENYIIERFKAHDLVRAGIALHRFGDLYAHVDENGKPYWGDRGHSFTGSPDIEVVESFDGPPVVVVKSFERVGHEPDLMFAGGARYNVAKVEGYQGKLANLLSRGIIAAGWAKPGSSVAAGVKESVKYFGKFYNDSVTTETGFVNKIVDSHRLTATFPGKSKILGTFEGSTNYDGYVIGVAKKLKSK